MFQLAAACFEMPPSPPSPPIKWFCGPDNGIGEQNEGLFDGTSIEEGNLAQPINTNEGRMTRDEILSAAVMLLY